MPTDGVDTHFIQPEQNKLLSIPKLGIRKPKEGKGKGKEKSLKRHPPQPPYPQIVGVPPYIDIDYLQRASRWKMARGRLLIQQPTIVGPTIRSELRIMMSNHRGVRDRVLIES